MIRKSLLYKRRCNQDAIAQPYRQKYNKRIWILRWFLLFSILIIRYYKNCVKQNFRKLLDYSVPLMQRNFQLISFLRLFEQIKSHSYILKAS